MATIDQNITDRWAVYNGDNCLVMPTLPDESVHLSAYSPPFACKGRGLAGLYQYSSSEHDFCNSRSYDEFFQHYEFLVKQIHRVTLRGRISAVHCMETPNDGANAGAGLTDFPGDIIRLHERLGWQYIGRHCVWKEPLGVRNRTMAKGLTHQTVIEGFVALRHGERRLSPALPPPRRGESDSDNPSKRPDGLCRRASGPQ